MTKISMENQKNEIINECINTRKTFRIIARENDMSMEEVYAIMNEYCQQNNYTSFRRSKNGIIFERDEDIILEEKIFEKEKGKMYNKLLKNARRIEEWAKVNGRKPRIRIEGIKAAKKGENNTKEQEELRWGRTYRYIRASIVKKYEGFPLENIQIRKEREIVRIIRQIDEQYKDARGIIAKDRGRKITLDNANGIEKWSKANGRQPRTAIKGVKLAEKGEKETKEQEEIRWGGALSTIRNGIMKEYNGKALEEIENKRDREIIKIIRELDKEFEISRKKRSLNNAKGIEKWSKANGREPRIIKGIKAVKEGENETKEQEESRWGRALNYIRLYIMKEYEGKSLKEIVDETDRKIVEIIRQLDKQYEVEKEQKSKTLNNEEETVQIEKKVEREERNVKFVQKLGNEKMKKMIMNLIKTKNATEEQVKTIADFYGVDLGKIINIQEER